MKIVFNTKYPNASASDMYGAAFKSIPNITYSDWDDYSNYNIALFMTYEDDLKDLKLAKKSYPQLKIGLIDPRGSQVDKVSKYVDFFIVDSIEMSDFFARYQKPIFTYYEYPNISTIKKTHIEKEKVIIGYHGNKLHLEGMYPKITKALEYLGDKYKIEFWAMYNWKSLGKAKFGIPKNIKTRHIQWSFDNYEKELSQVDIGIVPSLMPIRKINSVKKKAVLDANFFNDTLDDYLIRFKMPTNPSRIIVFGKLGIPVVVDMFPSALQLINNGYNGYIAYSSGGWYTALEQLILSHNKRNEYAQNMFNILNRNFIFEKQNALLLKFLQIIISRKKIEVITILETANDLHKNFKFRINKLKLLFKHKLRKIRDIIFTALFKKKNND
jgi:hypothetical protein